MLLATDSRMAPSIATCSASSRPFTTWMRLLEGMEFLYVTKFYLSQVTLLWFMTLWALKSVRIPKMASLPKREYAAGFEKNQKSGWNSQLERHKLQVFQMENCWPPWPLACSVAELFPSGPLCWWWPWQSIQPRSLFGTSFGMVGHVPWDSCQIGMPPQSSQSLKLSFNSSQLLVLTQQLCWFIVVENHEASLPKRFPPRILAPTPAATLEWPASNQWQLAG